MRRRPPSPCKESARTVPSPRDARGALRGKHATTIALVPSLAVSLSPREVANGETARTNQESQAVRRAQEARHEQGARGADRKLARREQTRRKKASRSTSSTRKRSSSQGGKRAQKQRAGRKGGRSSKRR